MIEYTLAFIFSNDLSNVLLIKRGKHEFHTGKLNGLGGKIYIGESPKACITRESKEEGNVAVPEDAWKFAGVMTSPEWKVWVFTTTIEKQDMKKETQEGIVDWYPTENVPKDIVSNLQWLIPFSQDKLKHPELTSFVVWYGALSKGEE